MSPGIHPLSWSFAILLVNCVLSEHTEATYHSVQIPVPLNRTQGWCLPLFLSLIPISSTNYLGPFLLAKCTLGRPVREGAAWVAESLGKGHGVFFPLRKRFSEYYWSQGGGRFHPGADGRTVASAAFTLGRKEGTLLARP